MKRSSSSAQPVESIAPQRGSLVTVRKAPSGASQYAVIVSNDIQNESSGYLLAVPLQRRTSRLKAPFAVDIGRKEGLRDLHTARCDWITRIPTKDIRRIERALLPSQVVAKIDEALKAALEL